MSTYQQAFNKAIHKPICDNSRAMVDEIFTIILSNGSISVSREDAQRIVDAMCLRESFLTVTPIGAESTGCAMTTVDVRCILTIIEHRAINLSPLARWWNHRENVHHLRAEVFA